MKKTSLTLLILLTGLSSLFAQVVLYSESFETDGEGTRYTSNTYSYCPTDPDYFYRTNVNPPLPSGCTSGFGSTLTNLQGSYFWAGEDIMSNQLGFPGNHAPGDITTSAINTSGYNTLVVSLYLATASNNNTRWESADSINIKVSFDGANYFAVGRFMGSSVSGGNLRIDSNLNGVIDGTESNVACDRSDFTKYSFSIPRTGASMRVKLDFDQFGGTEESAVDLIEVTGIVVMPLDLLNFKSTRIDNRTELVWRTANEVNTQNFEVESSTEGINFKKIASINTHNKSSNNYSYTDIKDYNSTVVYYRLKMVDLDGKFSYSDIASVYLDDKDLKVKTIYPNPSSDQVNIVINSNSEQPIQVLLKDLMGRVMLKQTCNIDNSTIDISSVVNGVFILETHPLDGKKQVFKLIKR